MIFFVGEHVFSTDWCEYRNYFLFPHAKVQYNYFIGIT